MWCLHAHVVLPPLPHAFPHAPFPHATPPPTHPHPQYNLSFYWSYLASHPDMQSTQESSSGRISSYMIGKAEGRGREWHGHVSAVTVAPEFRRLGLARTLCAELERVSDRVYAGYFVDLFVRVSNAVAIAMYARLGYVVYRRVLRYYDGEEDAFDMRKPLARDTEGASAVPLKAPIAAKDLAPTR